MHQDLTKFLRGDPAVSLSTLEDLTAGDAAADLQAADEHKRAEAVGRKPSLPQASALLTLKEIQLKAKHRSENRKRQACEIRQQTWKIFRDGMSSEFLVEPQPQGQQRESSLTRATKILNEHEDFNHIFIALNLIATARTSLAEARKHKIVHFVDALHNQSMTPLPLRSLTGKLMAAWRAEKANSRQSDG